MVTGDPSTDARWPPSLPEPVLMSTQTLGAGPVLSAVDTGEGEASGLRDPRQVKPVYIDTLVILMYLVGVEREESIIMFKITISVLLDSISISAKGCRPL